MKKLPALALRCFLSLLALISLLFSGQLMAQVGNYDTVNFTKSYSNQITSVLFNGNVKSGLVLHTNGSINYGLNGHLSNGFSFRWLAREDNAIDYSTDQYEIMKLDGSGSLKVKGNVSASTFDYSNVYTNQLRSVVYSSNNRSGTIMQSSASINFGMTGPKQVGFRFRWLAHDNGSINYAGDEDVLMSLDPNGLLKLKGTMNANKVKVTQEVWPDYVFNMGYALPSLQQVESYINEHRHLQGIPSAREIKENGLDVGQQQADLLKKVEELTLYIIDLNKKLEQHQEKINTLEQRLAK